MSTFPLRAATRRTAFAATAALAAVLAVAGPAAAHAEVNASDPRALAQNVTLTFTSEAESDTAGIAKLQIVLPEGITPDAVSLKEAPAGWKLTPSQGGYTVGGKALATGTDAVHSITVKQLPDAKSLVFKTIETYGDGKVDRWIELPSGGEEPENPAPVLALKPAAPGATASSAAPTPSPTPTPPKAAAAPSGKTAETAEKDDAADNGVAIAVVAAVAVIAAGFTVWWFRRRPGTDSA
ncbi:DUF1775 domain-containing protein [Streptomyces sp. CA-135486]|uniref:DUF1775 domain-containing protein n=1 Tax=Streptomyces sp. CA-135486 TaxID=3240049 RepID=UPI003D8C4159